MFARASVLAFVAGGAMALASASADDRSPTDVGVYFQGISQYNGGPLQTGLYLTSDLNSHGYNFGLRGPGGMPIPFDPFPGVWFAKAPAGSNGGSGPGALPNSIRVTGDDSDPNGTTGLGGGFVGMNTFVDCPPSVLPLCAVTFTLNEYVSGDINQYDLPVFKLVNAAGADTFFALTDPRGPHAGSAPFGIPNAVDNDNQLLLDPVGFSYTFILGPSVDGPYHIGLGVFSFDGAFGAGVATFSNVFADKVPAPGAFALVGMGGLLAARRRRS